MYACIMRVHKCIAGDPLPCGEILRAAFIGMSLQKHAATFRGWQDFKVRRDFEETQYIAGRQSTVQAIKGDLPYIRRWLLPTRRGSSEHDSHLGRWR